MSHYYVMDVVKQNDFGVINKIFQFEIESTLGSVKVRLQLKPSWKRSKDKRLKVNEKLNDRWHDVCLCFGKFNGKYSLESIIFSINYLPVHNLCGIENVWNSITVELIINGKYYLVLK